MIRCEWAEADMGKKQGVQDGGSGQLETRF